MTPPRFSVVIPVFNGAAYVGRAIESALDQTYAAHEILVVDDGSVDDTAEIVGGYGDRVRLLRQANAGVSSARNLGAQTARGDWLAFLDADDWYYPDRLARHAELIRDEASLDFLTGDYDYVRPDGSRISGSMEIHPSGKKMLARANGQPRVLMTEADLEAFVAEHFGDTHTLSVPRATFLALGGYPTGYRVCEDVFFLVKLCATSKNIGVACSPLGAYLIHSVSATRRDPLQAQLDNVRTLRAMADWAVRAPPAVANGVRARLAQGRLNLAYAQLRAGRRGDALRAVAPSLWESPGKATLRNVLSVMRG